MVEVRISQSEILHLRGEMTLMWLVMERLKEAGVPVLGALLFRGVEHGTLERRDDPESGDIIFCWAR